MNSKTDIYDLIRSTITNSIKKEVYRIKAIKAVEEIQLTHLSLYNNSTDFFIKLKPLVSTTEYNKLIDIHFNSKIALMREEVFEFSFHTYKLIELAINIWWNAITENEKLNLENETKQKFKWEHFDSNSIGAKIAAFPKSSESISLPKFDWGLMNLIKPLRNAYAHGGLDSIIEIPKKSEKDLKPIWLKSFIKGEKKFLLKYADACQNYCRAQILLLAHILENNSFDEQ